MSQRAFAERMEFSRDYISRLETGNSTNPSHRFIQQLEHLERLLEYSSTARQGESNMSPPHVEPPFRLREDAPLFATKVTQEDYLAAVNIIGKLFDTDARKFQAALDLLKRLSNEK